MSVPSPRSLTALVAVAGFALVSLSCSRGPDRGRPIESLELTDFTVAGMFKQVSLQLGRPYVLELPPEGDPTQQDLKLSDSDERAVLEALCRLDPSLQADMDGPAWMLFPSGAAEEASPFSRRIAVFGADGGVFPVLQQLISQALPSDTALVMSNEGKARPVRMQMKDATVREVLAEVAAQAQLGFVVEPGYVRVSVVPEP